MSVLAPAVALGGLNAVAGRYRVLFCDVWGVIHNGVAAFPAAVAALRRFRQEGGIVVLVTNAPRPSDPIVAMLDGLGIGRDAYDAIVSSGDATRAMVARYSGRVVHHIGPPTSDDAFYAGLEVTRGAIEDAEAIVVTDMPSDAHEPGHYLGQMTGWLDRRLPMICANPDRVVEVGDRIVFCGGALADVYAEAGGTVLMAGKPYGPIYEEALARAEAVAGGTIPREAILAVGDSVRTDATGAAGFGIDFLFVTGSIHAEELDAFGAPDARVIAELVAPTGAHLVGYLPRLVW